jgi:hypothetical protein
MNKIPPISKVALPSRTMQGHAPPPIGQTVLEQRGIVQSPDQAGSHLPGAARGVLDKFPAQAAEIRRVASTK